MISVTLEMVQYDCPYIDTTDDHEVSFSALQWEFDPSAARLETRMLVEGADRDALAAGLDALEGHPHLHQCDLRSKHGEIARLDTAILEIDAMATIRARGGYVTGPFHIEAGSERWHLGFDSPGVVNGALGDDDREPHPHQKRVRGELGGGGHAEYPRGDDRGRRDDDPERQRTDEL